MVSLTFMCYCNKEAEGAQNDSQLAGGNQEDSEQAGSTASIRIQP